MARVNIDGAEHDLPAGQNLLHALLSQRLELPYFCWHPALGAVGACRQCAVIQYANEEDQRGRLQMACMMPVQEGLRVSIDATFAANFRKQVIEWLMENHPHDCPVCEEGGECHLQDMTVMTGHSMRRYEGRKRTWSNQYLGPFVGHEMNRCITCYRCVRFYRDYAGGKDLEAFGSRGRMYFGRARDGVLESEFSGNLVEVCPTGVFTDKPFSKLYTRKWDLQSAPSLCPGCSVGCNTIPGERYGQLKRVHNRYHGELNGYFLCDRGRFGSHFVNSDGRMKRAGVRAADGVFEATGRQAALEAAAKLLQAGARPIGIGSPRASVEANHALKQLVGTQNFCAGLGDAEAACMEAALDIYRAGGFLIPSLKDMEQADAVLILGEDVSNTAARVALAVRQAVRGATLDMAHAVGIPDWQDAGVRGHGQGARSPLFIAAAASTRLDELAVHTRRGLPRALADAGFAIADAVREGKPAADAEFVAAAAAALAQAKRPLIISGTEAQDANLPRAAASVALALRQAGASPMLALVAAEANSYGAALAGGELPLSQALERMRDGAPAIVLENDLFRRAAGGDVKLDDAIVLDALETPTAAAAAVVLPAATYAEQTGAYVNYETRAQRFYQVFEPTDEVAPSWRWISAIAAQLGRNDAHWPNIDALTAACSTGALEALAGVAPPADFRAKAHNRIPRQPHRYSGRTAMRAQLSVHEPKATVDDETPLAYSMEGQNVGDQPGAVVPYVWAPGWNSNQSVFRFQQEVGGALAGGDPGVRLLENRDASPEPPPSPAPSAVGPPDEGRFHVARISEIFGSDELSAASAPIAERMSAPYVALNPADAETLGVAPGGGVRVNGLASGFAVRLDANLPERCVGLVQGLPGAPPIDARQVALAADPDYTPPSTSDVIAKG